MAIITNLLPPPGEAIGASDPVSFDVIDPAIEELRVFVWSVFTGSADYELVYDGDNFTPNYSFSTITPTTGGRTFTFHRVGGWPEAPDLRVDTCACPPTTGVSNTTSIAVTGATNSDVLELVANNTSPAVTQANHDAVQAALTAMASTGGELVFGSGVFHVDTDNNGPLLYHSSTTVRGLNRISSRVQGNGDSAVFAPANGSAFSFLSGDRTLNVKFSNLGIWNTSAATAGGICLDSSQVSNSDFSFLDFRQSETGLYHSGVAYSNEFNGIQASGCDTGFHFFDGCNENDVVNCRASGVDIGFLFEDGTNSAINALTMDRCTVETFTDAAVRVHHNDDAANDFDVFRLLNSRFTNGPTGFDIVEDGAGLVTNLFIANTLNDGLTNLLNWTTPAGSYLAATTAVLVAMRSNARNFTMIHGGKIFPVRPAQHNNVELNGNALIYQNSASQLAVRGTADTTNGDFAANDITSQTNGPGTERVNFNRLRVGGGTLHDSADYTASGWGTSPTIAFPTASYDPRGRVSIQAGASPSANPTLTLDWASGNWPTPPVVMCSRGDALSTAGEWRVTAVSTSDVEFTFIGTPVASETYILGFHVIG